MSVKDEKVPINSTDELSVAGGRLADRVRTLGEYKPTNTPLSAAEIARRKRLDQSTDGKIWTPPEMIADMAPIPD
jgi:hypothetical protein